MRAFWIALSTVVTLGCVVYLVIAARAPTSPKTDPPLTRPIDPTPAPTPASVPAPAPSATPPTAPPTPPMTAATELGARAVELLDEADYEGAREAALKCLAIDSGRSNCHYALTASYTRVGKWHEAYPLLVECVKRDPGNDTCRSSLVTYHLRSRNLDEARVLVEQMQSTSRDSLWTHLAAAEYASATDDRDGACIHFKQACELGQSYACTRARQACSPSGLGSE